MYQLVPALTVPDRSRPDERDGSDRFGAAPANHRGSLRSVRWPPPCKPSRWVRSGSAVRARARSRRGRGQSTRAQRARPPRRFVNGQPPLGRTHPETERSTREKMGWKAFHSSQWGRSRGRESSRRTSRYGRESAPGRAITRTSRGGSSACCQRRKTSRTTRRTRFRCGAPPTLRLVVMPSCEGGFRFVRVITTKCGVVRRRPSR